MNIRFLRWSSIVWLGLAMVTCGEAVQDYRFKVEKLGGGIPQPMELEIAPDGRIFFNEYGGRLKFLRPGTGEIVEAGKIEVFTGQENGFLGFALDPQFAKNGWVYCLYSPPNFHGQALSRFTMKGDALDLGSERVLLRYEEQRKECCHHAGAVEFGPDGNLYFSTGDNTHPHGDSGGFAPIDERPDKAPWDAQKSAANTMSLAGKICRIRPTEAGGYEIPEGNLFPAVRAAFSVRDQATGMTAAQLAAAIATESNRRLRKLSPEMTDEELHAAERTLERMEKSASSKARPEIYAMGCRNPWRMSIDAKTGFVYWGEVGPDANGDGPRGPRGYDEINQAKRAGNFGWPYFIGDNFAYHDFDYVTKKGGASFDPARPVNDSPNNRGLRELPAAEAAFIYWPYRQATKWSELGEGGRTACAGPVYYSQAGFERTNGFPAHFNRCLLFWDWERPFMKWARLDTDSNLVAIEPFTSAVVLANKAEQIAKLQEEIAEGATLVKRPVDAVFGKDGCLYVLDYGETWGANKDSQLLKISYVRGNLAPIAKAVVTPDAGREPLSVNLSAAGSKDLEGDALTYTWRLQPGGKLLGNSPEANLTIAEPGNYIAEVEVKDAKGGTDKVGVPVHVGNSAPTVEFQIPRGGDFFTPEKKLAYQVVVADAEDGKSRDKPEEFAVRTLVSSSFERADGKDDALGSGFSLMKQSDCFNCHAVEQKVIGPSLLEIANKYRGQASALETSIKRVRDGSSNVWGPIPMLPHPQHTTDEVAIMLRWVFSLEKGKGAPALNRGLAGEVTAPKDDKPGVLILEASYTDGGRGAVSPLTRKVRVKLRSRRVEAESGEASGPRELGLSGASGKKGLGAINDGHFVKFTDLNLRQCASVTARTSSGGVGGRIELHAGSPKGELLAVVEVPVTGGWDTWQEATVPLKPFDRTDVYAVFVNAGKGGLMNLDWLRFNP